jgi:hypothetical protein
MQQAISHLMVEYRAAPDLAAHRVTMWVDAEMLQWANQSVFRQVPLGQINWADTRTSGKRRIQLDGGGHISAMDPMLWDAWLQAMPSETEHALPHAASRGWLMLGTAVILCVAALSGLRLMSQ